MNKNLNYFIINRFLLKSIFKKVFMKKKFEIRGKDWYLRRNYEIIKLMVKFNLLLFGMDKKR